MNFYRYFLFEFPLVIHSSEASAWEDETAPCFSFTAQAIGNFWLECVVVWCVYMCVCIFCIYLGREK